MAAGTDTDAAALHARGVARALAGGVAGVTEAVLLHPTDITKSHIHAASFPRANGAAPNIRSTVAGIYNTMGARGFTRGTAALATHLAIKYPVRYYVNTGLYSLAGVERSTASTMTNFTFGGLTGLVEVMLVVAPVENLKTYQQMASKKGLAPGYPAAIRHIHASRGGGFAGLRGFWSGATPTVGRNVLNQCFLFGAAPEIKRLITGGSTDSSPAVSFVAGTVAATMGPALNNGLDQAKTRMMIPGNTKTMLEVIRQDIGLRYWFRGLLPRLGRIAPGGGIQTAIVADLAPWIHRRLFPEYDGW